MPGGDTLLPFSCAAAASLEPRPWAAAGRGLFSAALFAAPHCSPFSLQLCQPSGPALRSRPRRITFPEVCLELSQRLGRALPCQQTEGWRLWEENPVKNEMALLCSQCSHCAVRSSYCKLVFDGFVYCLLTHSPGWHTCTSM